MLGYSRENNGKTDFDKGTNSYVGTSFKQYIEKKNGNMPLEDRWHVTFVSVRNSEWKKMDFSKYDTILHVAAIVHQKEQPEMEALYYAVNTKLTEELADKARAERVRQFVFLSTMSVYGMTMGQITEETECTPILFMEKASLPQNGTYVSKEVIHQSSGYQTSNDLWESLYRKLCFIGEAGGQDTCFSESEQ